jgi:hypothetical protein
LREVRGRRCSAGATASSFRSASSTQPHAAQRPRRNHDGCSRIRRRLDGGFTLALRNRGKVELSPDLFRYARTFWPTYKHRRKGLWKVVLRSVRARYELEPRPTFTVRDRARARSRPRHVSLVSAALIKSNPELKDIEVAEAWGGTIDRTPDAIPVISPIDTMLGFFLATGFSGHGFGIGPAAGKLAADIVTAMRCRSLASRGKTQAELPHAPRLRGEHQLTRLGRVRASGGSSPTGALERDHSCKS